MSCPRVGATCRACRAKWNRRKQARRLAELERQLASAMEALERTPERLRLRLKGTGNESA